MPPLSLCQLQAVVLQADMDVLEAELAVLVSETEDEVVSNPGQEVAIPSRYLFCDAETWVVTLADEVNACSLPVLWQHLWATENDLRLEAFGHSLNISLCNDKMSAA